MRLAKARWGWVNMFKVLSQGAAKQGLQSRQPGSRALYHEQRHVSATNICLAELHKGPMKRSALPPSRVPKPSQNKWDVENAKHSDVKPSAPKQKASYKTWERFPISSRKRPSLGWSFRQCLVNRCIYLFQSLCEACPGDRMISWGEPMRNISLPLGLLIWEGWLQMRGQLGTLSTYYVGLMSGEL